MGTLLGTFQQNAVFLSHQSAVQIRYAWNTKSEGNLFACYMVVVILNLVFLTVFVWFTSIKNENNHTASKKCSIAQSGWHPGILENGNVAFHNMHSDIVKNTTQNYNFGLCLSGYSKSSYKNAALILKSSCSVNLPPWNTTFVQAEGILNQTTGLLPHPSQLLFALDSITPPPPSHYFLLPEN